MRRLSGVLDHRLHERPFVDRLHVVAGADAVDPRAARPSSSSRAIRQTIEELSSPPDRQLPTGTSERRCSRTDCVKQLAEPPRRLALADVERARFENAIPAPHRQRLAGTPVLQIETNAFAAFAAAARRRTSFRPVWSMMPADRKS